MLSVVVLTQTGFARCPERAGFGDKKARKPSSRKAASKLFASPNTAVTLLGIFFSPAWSEAGLLSYKTSHWSAVLKVKDAGAARLNGVNGYRSLRIWAASSSRSAESEILDSVADHHLTLAMSTTASRRRGTKHKRRRISRIESDKRPADELLTAVLPRSMDNAQPRLLPESREKIFSPPQNAGRSPTTRTKS
jgi:hypothetical protein